MKKGEFSNLMIIIIVIVIMILVYLAVNGVLKNVFR